MIKGNVSEIEKIVKEMTTDYKSAPNYNAAAAEIVKQGVIDRHNAKYGYGMTPVNVSPGTPSTSKPPLGTVIPLRPL
jgi:hypothetical protein